MKIEINEKGSRAFYNETVNVMSQFKALSRNPAAKLRDNLGAMKRYSIICGALLVMLRPCPHTTIPRASKVRSA